MTENMTGIDSAKDYGTINDKANPSLICLGRYADGDFITKHELSHAFGCSERTLQRMVERYEIPPPVALAGRKVWIVGKVKAWLANTADRQETEAIREAQRLRIFDR